MWVVEFTLAARRRLREAGLPLHESGFSFERKWPSKLTHTQALAERKSDAEGSSAAVAIFFPFALLCSSSTASGNSSSHAPCSSPSAGCARTTECRRRCNRAAARAAGSVDDDRDTVHHCRFYYNSHWHSSTVVTPLRARAALCLLQLADALASDKIHRLAVNIYQD